MRLTNLSGPKLEFGIFFSGIGQAFAELVARAAGPATDSISASFMDQTGGFQSGEFVGSPRSRATSPQASEFVRRISLRGHFGGCRLGQQIGKALVFLGEWLDLGR